MSHWESSRPNCRFCWFSSATLVERYEAFGLMRAHWRQYLNVESIFRMLTAWLSGHFVGPPAGDVERMPGVFLLRNNQIEKAFRHKLVSDRPDYLALAAAS